MKMTPKNIKINAYLDVFIGICILLTGIHIGAKYDPMAMWLVFAAIRIVIAAANRVDSLDEEKTPETPKNDAK
jgi:hypothetical protein